MAVQTIYVLATAAVSPNWFGQTQLNGSAPTVANTAYGWSANKIAVGYIRGRLGATTTASDAVVGTSYNAGTSGPTKGTGSGANTAGDSFIAGPFNGTFAATAWTFAWNLRASTAGCVGHVNMRVWKSANAAGTSATQLAANALGATVTLSTTADVNSSISWSPGALTLTNEYLFFQVEWQETTLGTTNGDNVLFRVGTTAITTPNFAAIVDLAGDLASTTTLAAPLDVAGSNYGVGPYGGGPYSRLPIVVGQTRDLAGNLAPAVSFAVDLTVTPATVLAGDLAPVVALSAVLNSIEVFAGDFAPAVLFNGGLDLAGAPDLAGDFAPSITLAGNLTTIDLFAGDLASAVSFVADLTVVLAINLAGDLAPSVTFSTTDLLIIAIQDLGGNLAPSVALAANLSVDLSLAGDLAPQMALGASLTGDWLLVGDMTVGVDFAAGLASGPLWQGSEVCPPPIWDESELCPPSLWTPTIPPNWTPEGAKDPLGYGMRAYGKGPYNEFTSPWLPTDLVLSTTWTASTPPDDVSWDETELCDG